MNSYKTIPYTLEYMPLSKSFHCGNPSIDSFLSDNLSLEKWFGKTFIWIDNNEIVGFYNIGVGYIRDTDYSNYKIGGSVHINYFAVNNSYRNVFNTKLSDKEFLKTSDWLMNDLLKRVEDIRNHHLGFSLITLNSTDFGYNLYKRSGFEELEEGLEFDNKDDEDECISMYLSLDLEE